MSEGGPPRWFDDTRQVAGQLSGDFKCYAAAHFFSLLNLEKLA